MSEGEGEHVAETSEWEHDYGRNPFENFKRLVEEVPLEVPDDVLIEIANRSIAGMGGEMARQALDRIRSERSEHPGP